MARAPYQQSLVDLRDGVLELGNLVVARLETALECLETGDESMAQTVIEADHEINERYLDLEDDCIDLFALQQPVAGDLRFVAASFKILTDLERIGDLATNLAGYAITASEKLVPEVEIGQIGRDVVALVERSLDAYADEDTAACRQIAAADDEIDTLCQNASELVARDLIEREASDDSLWAVEQLLDDVSRVLLTIRDLERVADHAVNIAARTLYMVETSSELIY